MAGEDGAVLVGDGIGFFGGENDGVLVGDDEGVLVGEDGGVLVGEEDGVGGSIIKFLTISAILLPSASVGRLAKLS